MINEYTQLRCPVCNHTFPSSEDIKNFMNHTKQCRQKHHKQNKHENKQQFVYQKIAVDETKTKYRWEKRPKQIIDPSLLSLSKNQVSTLNFQQKQSWFRTKLQSLRIPWTSGSDWLRLNKDSLLLNSLAQLPQINMHKEVKVEFKDQKVNDAGGLLREWIHMVIKEIFDIQTGIFMFTDTEGDTMYSLKWDEEFDEEFGGKLLWMLGVIIGKAIFERIPVNCFMDRTILRQLCGGEVVIQDIYGYDAQLYKNWKYLLQSNIESEQLDTYFTTYRTSPTTHTIQQFQLLQGHKDIKLDNSNKKLYIDLWQKYILYLRSIEFHTKLHKCKSIQSIISGISTVFNHQWLQIFMPHQLQMIMYGVPFIDLQDWHDNTEYKEPYEEKNQVVRWFWEVMDGFDQEQLARILHFCTASTRTPIQGFSRLESNRGNYAKFLIVPTEYSKKNPYPKGHTCFNRLQLPMYPNYDTLKIYLTAISKNELDGVFGLD